MAKKPKVEDAPSQIAVVGRYIIQPEVIDHLGLKKRGASGEIQLTDSLSFQINKSPFYAYNFSGERYDCGNKLGFINDDNVDELIINFNIIFPEKLTEEQKESLENLL